MNFFICGRQRNCDIISHDLIKLRLIIIDIKARNNIRKNESLLCKANASSFTNTSQNICGN